MFSNSSLLRFRVTCRAGSRDKKTHKHFILSVILQAIFDQLKSPKLNIMAGRCYPKVGLIMQNDFGVKIVIFPIEKNTDTKWYRSSNGL